jgi:hypothetical protein
MESLINHLNENAKFYGFLMTVAGFAILYVLGQRFTTKKEFSDFKTEFSGYKKTTDLKLDEHDNSYNSLSEAVTRLDTLIEHLPTHKEASELKVQMSKLEGQLEGLQPLIKTLLNHNAMLMENEITGGKK